MKEKIIAAKGWWESQAGSSVLTRGGQQPQGHLCGGEMLWLMLACAKRCLGWVSLSPMAGQKGNVHLQMNEGELPAFGGLCPAGI